MTDAANDAGDDLAFVAARAMCRRRDRDFYFASRFLPGNKRNAACAVWAFFGMIADAIGAEELTAGSATALREHPVVASPGLQAGDCGSADSAEARIALLRARLDEIYAGAIELPAIESRSEPQHVLSAMQWVVRRHEIPRQHFLDFAEGCGADATVRRYATWSSLERYLDRSAGSVALTLSCVLGVTHSDAPRHALALGRAMRLTSILRDLKSDLHERGRLYLPLEDLARFRYSERDLSAGVLSEAFRDLMKFEIARARDFYRDAASGLCWLAGDGSRLMAATVIAVQSHLLRPIELANYDVFSRRITLSGAQKLRRLPLAWRLAKRLHDDSVIGDF